MLRARPEISSSYNETTSETSIRSKLPLKTIFPTASTSKNKKNIEATQNVILRTPNICIVITSLTRSFKLIICLLIDGLLSSLMFPRSSLMTAAKPINRLVYANSKSDIAGNSNAGVDTVIKTLTVVGTRFSRRFSGF